MVLAGQPRQCCKVARQASSDPGVKPGLSAFTITTTTLNSCTGFLLLIELVLSYTSFLLLIELVLSYTSFLLLIELALSCPLLHIVLYLHNNHPTWLVSGIFRMSLGSSDHQFHNSLLCLKQNLAWANMLSLSLRLGSGMNSPSL